MVYVSIRYKTQPPSAIVISSLSLDLTFTEEQYSCRVVTSVRSTWSSHNNEKQGRFLLKRGIANHFGAHYFTSVVFLIFNSLALYDLCPVCFPFGITCSVWLRISNRLDFPYRKWNFAIWRTANFPINIHLLKPFKENYFFINRYSSFPSLYNIHHSFPLKYNGSI